MHSSKKARTIISLFMAVFICSCSSDGHGDTTPPTVVSTTPAAGANNIGVNSSIAAVFSEPMDSSTISTSTISVNKAGSNIAGTVTYAGNTATFTPSNPLLFNSAYTVTISGNIKDANGNRMSADYTLSFTTVSYPSNHPVIWESGPSTTLDNFYYKQVDINLDGVSDLCIRQNGTVTYYNGKDFSQLWQLTTSEDHYVPIILAETAVGKFTPVDVDGDGQKEVLFMVDYTDTVTGKPSATLYIYSTLTHALKWQNTYTYTPPAGSTGQATYSATVGDFDGDGVYEIVVTQQATYTPAGTISGTGDSWVKVLKGQNHAIAWDSGILTKSMVSASIWRDVNLDGINDLMISEYGPASITIYNGKDLSQLLQFTTSTYHDLYLPAPSKTGIGKYDPVDVDGDGNKELLLIDKYFGNDNPPGITLYIYDALTHALKWQNTYIYTPPTGGTGAQANYGVNVRDIDGDGVYEIILTQSASYYANGSTSTYDNRIKVLKGPSHAVAWDSGPLTEDMDRFSRVVADINVDGINDLIIRKKGTNPSITFYRGSDFSPLWQFTSSADHVISEIMAETSLGVDSPVDVDGDGQEEVLILDTYNDASAGNANATLYVYDAATHALKWQTTYTYTLPAGSYGYVSYRADVEDIDGDGVYEIILSQIASYKAVGASTYTYDNWVKVLK